MSDCVTINFIRKLNTLVIRHSGEDRLFYTTGDGLIISRQSLVRLIHFLVMSNLISPKSLEGILEDYYSNR